MNMLSKKEMLYDIKHLPLDSLLYSFLDASRKWFYRSITITYLLPGAVVSPDCGMYFLPYGQSNSLPLPPSKDLQPGLNSCAFKM